MFQKCDKQPHQCERLLLSEHAQKTAAGTHRVRVDSCNYVEPWKSGDLWVPHVKTATAVMLRLHHMEGLVLRSPSPSFCKEGFATSDLRMLAKTAALHVQAARVRRSDVRGTAGGVEAGLCRGLARMSRGMHAPCRFRVLADERGNS